jgi:hypothetical protein
MIDGRADLPDIIGDLFVACDIRTGPDLFDHQRPERFGRDDLPGNAKARQHDAHVVGIGQVIGADAWGRAPLRVAQRNFTTALRPADTEDEGKSRPAMQAGLEAVSRKIEARILDVRHRLGGV